MSTINFIFIGTYYFCTKKPAFVQGVKRGEIAK
jgi:hypothetical protein